MRELKMKRIETELKDCYILEPDKFGDKRGYYSPVFIEKDNIKNQMTMKSIVQVARSMSAKGVIRGLHFQKDPYCQSKLVECLRGKIIDVAVDLRKDSPSYLKWVSVELTPENGKQLYIPRGFAHGFVSLADNSLFQYYVDNDYEPGHEGGILWRDPEININWPLKENDIILPDLKQQDEERLTAREANESFYLHKDYLVTGVSGQLGHDVVKELHNRGIFNILELTSKDMDITDERFVKKVIEEYRPMHIIHCAAYTNVNKAEDDIDTCMNVNVKGTKYIAEAARNIGAKLTYISTDYIFDGKKDGIYEVNDTPNPINNYGLSKLLGEEQALKNDKTFIVRTSWVFGINGNNFVKTMLNKSDEVKEVNVVCDQIGSPTYTKDLAKLLVDMQQTEHYGIYHATNNGYCSWAEFAKYIYQTNNKDIKINEVLSSSYSSKVKRPLNSRLSATSLTSAGFNSLPSWQSAIDRYNEELGQTRVLKK
jgi:dTDP-4-dehydrorhamnose reductase/dTDP-4-dehydrorhamnose 3,5-epimerase